MSEKTRGADWLVFAALAILTVGLAVRAGNSDFTYSDASRHAMDGVFVLDAAAERPVDAPLKWAESYYATSPALGFGRYPPLLAAIQAPFYAILGVCPFAGRLAVALTWLAGCVFFYESLRRGLGRAAAAFGAGVLALGPGTVRWSGEVMLELPAIAFLAAAAYFFVRYRETGCRVFLTWSVVTVSLAAWVKQPAIVALVPVVVAVPLYGRSVKSSIRDLWPGLVAAVILVAPLTAISLRFGRANLMLLSGAGAQYELLGLGNWLYYITQIPLYYVGWAPVIFIIAGLAAAATGKARGSPGLWALWGLTFYLFFTLVGYKSARLAMFMTPALAYFAAVGFERFWDGSGKLARTAVVLAATAALAGALWAGICRLPERSGEIRLAAIKALEVEPARILYSGRRNGTFVFRVREIAGRKRPSVVRTSKMFYVLTIQKELVAEYRPWTPDEIRERLEAIAPDVLVIETGDYDGAYEGSVDFQLALYAEDRDFALLDTVDQPGPGNRQIKIYRYTGQKRPRALELPLPGVGFDMELPPVEI